MIQIPYFKSEEIEEIINNKKDLVDYFKKNNINENLFGDNYAEEDYEDEEMEEDGEEGYENEENDVESMSDKEKVKLAYEILSMTAYEDEFFMGILGRLRKLMRK